MTTRGTALALLGLMWIGRGLTIAVDPGAIPADAAIIHVFLPIPIRIGLWVATGLVALAAGLWARGGWQMIGWAAVLIMPAQRAISHAWSLAMWIIPGGPPGTLWSAAGILWWVANVFLLLLMARWPDPREDR